MNTVKTEKHMRLSATAKRELSFRSGDEESYGFSLGDVKSLRSSNRFFLCFIRAILIFLACFGTLGGLVSSFGLPFSLPVVALGIFFLSLITAFLYYNRLTFYLGYFLVFGGFIFLSLSFYWYVNSGYQAFMNEVFNKYSDYFRLLATREATEFIENRYLSVTTAMLFMGWFFCILFNITISGYMNLPATFLLSFLPLQVAFYIDIVPPIPYLCMLIAVYISVAVLGRSGHFTLPYRREPGQDFSRKRKKKKTEHVYFASSRGMLQIAGISISLSAAFLVLSGSLFATEMNGRYISNTVKDRTDELVKSVVQGGIYSLFNRYYAVGGLAHGKLGGIGNVNPDFETDLIIRLVPSNSTSLYLKSYTGFYYKDNSFFASAGEGEEILGEDELLEAEDYLPRLPAGRDVDMDSLYEDHDYVSKLWISIVGADTSYDYRPYFTILGSRDSALPGSGISEERKRKAEERFAADLDLLDSQEVIDSYNEYDAIESYEQLYLPFDERIAYDPNPDISPEYQQLVYDTCLQVPEELYGSLEYICRDAGLYDTAGAYDPDSPHPLAPESEAELQQYKQLQTQRLLIANALRRYFVKNYEYTMSPGTTPRRSDVVDYFLHNQKRGYCAHFASSSTLLLRHMGIPTRYVEGYVCTISDIMDGNPVSRDVSGWQSNADSLSDSGVVEVELTDGSAHAWIEIWLDGYGWIPYEMTPPSSEQQNTALDLFGLFGGLLNTTMRGAGDNSTDAQNANNNITRGNFPLFNGSLNFLLKPLSILLAALVLFLLSIPLLKRFREDLRLSRHKRRGEYGEALLLLYRRFLRRLKKQGRLPSSHPALREVFDMLRRNDAGKKLPPEEELTSLQYCLEQAAYDRSGPDAAACRSAAVSLKKLMR
ncbi:MAG: hypothetical protein IK115_03750 [Lachnospiraceae bacterium]|nr:hypothetical protein [Lachnospiraceae bacterium]